MGLYLCVMDPETEEEADGVEVGPYSYFNAIRDRIRMVFGADANACFPLLLAHADSQGRWSPEEATRLQREIMEIKSTFQTKPTAFVDESEWYLNLVVAHKGRSRVTLADCVLEVDGAPLFDRIIELCQKSIDTGWPILFQ